MKKLISSLLEGTITKKQFDEIYEKEKHKVSELTNQIKRIELFYTDDNTLIIKL